MNNVHSVKRVNMIPKTVDDAMKTKEFSVKNRVGKVLKPTRKMFLRVREAKFYTHLFKKKQKKVMIVF